MNKKLTVIGVDGTVIREVVGYDVSNFNPSSFGVDETPVITDSNISGTSIVRGYQLPNGDTAGRLVTVSPVTEQFVNGTMYGSFILNEQLFQSQYIPEIVNNLIIDGQVAVSYNPVVANITSTVGITGPEIGNRCAKFSGSYLGTDTKAAGIKLPSFSTAGITHFMFSGFLYFETLPSAYDPIVITRTADGVNASTNDSFRLEYDISSNQLQFHFATANTSSAGMPYILNLCPANGVSTGQWHQFAIAYSNIGGSACASAYWNGVRSFQYTGISGSIKNSTAPLMLGSGISGDKPLNGYLEHIMVSAGGETLALREFSHGATAPTDSASQFAGDYTIYALSMNGPLGESLFPCASTKRIVSSASYIDPYTGTIGVSNLSRENTSIHGATLFSGIDGGHTASNSAINAGYLFGYDSGACMNISNVTSNISAITDSKKIKGSLIDHTISYLLGGTAMRGTCAFPGDFPRLFSGGTSSFSGRTYSFLPNTYNVSSLRSIYDDIIIAGRTGTYYYPDYEGNMYTFSTGGIKNLYADVVSYQTTAYSEATAIKNAISSSASISAINELGGISAEGIVRKLAPEIGKNSYLYLVGKGKATKQTKTPEVQAQLDADSYLGLKG